MMRGPSAGSATPTRETGRVEAFTDGVFAIAITLLVLDLPIPTSGNFAGSLAEHWPSFLAYAAAFFTLAAIWVHHHALFAQIRRVEPPVLLLNLLLLLGISLLPWPTSLIAMAIQDGNHLDGVIACGLFAAASLIVMCGWLGLSIVLAHRPHLLVEDSGVEWMRSNAREVLVAGIPVVLAAAAAFLNPALALALFIAVPIYFFYSTSRVRSRPDPEPADTTPGERR
ncbi:TMEM175 family protein [Herbiconiux ginsengi]|uniref:Uncharacterized membrane protein n=1 Tax=Herbiconiux ginsengi TaxID=381665 RepID=A0A1H3LWE4_9MICO|nr:TMEM175 family protein [Herbiconiux ginsengi]SDY68740.1 Uncharacterized membrane protein [Herbiconiux ginsengi]